MINFGLSLIGSRASFSFGLDVCNPYFYGVTLLKDAEWSLESSREHAAKKQVYFPSCGC